MSKVSDRRGNVTATLKRQAEIRVLVVHGSPIFAEALCALLSRENDITVVGSCNDRLDALRFVRASLPDVALITLEMNGHDGMELCRDLSNSEPRCRTVLLATTLTEDDSLDALRLGVDGVVLKEMPSRLLVQCIRKVAAGGKWIEKIAIEHAIERMLRHDEAIRKARVNLTQRELDVIRLAAQGLRNKEIANTLCLGEGTVKVYLHSIYEKLNITSRIELSLHAQRAGIV